MKSAEAILAASLAIVLTGCVLRSTPKTTQSVPAAPRPPVAPAPATPPQQLSIAQPHPDLPAPQPISNEALATTEPAPEEPPRAPTPPKPTRNRATPPRTEAPAPPPAVTPPAPEPDAVRPPVQELVPAEEQRQQQANAQRDRQEAGRLLERATAHSLNRRQQVSKRNIESFLQLSLDAEKRGDMRQASDFAARALLLAKELQP